MEDNILNPAEELDSVLDQGGQVDDSNVDDSNDDTETELSGEEELLKALKALAEEDDSDGDNVEDDENNSDDETDDEENTDDQGTVDEGQESKKKEQTPEENAKFAAQRRQKELNDRVQKELERVRAESPEFALAKQLSEMYGTDPNTLLKQVQEAKLKKEAEQKGVPFEYLQEREADRQQVQALQQQLNQIKYESWKSRIESESATLQNDYKMLSQEDMQEAVNYMLNVARNTDMPLEQAVYAIHGKKIVEALAQGKVQDELAKQSGRAKKTALPVKGGKPSETATLTAEEKYMARQFGMTDEEYLKYK